MTVEGAALAEDDDDKTATTAQVMDKEGWDSEDGGADVEEGGFTSENGARPPPAELLYGGAGETGHAYRGPAGRAAHRATSTDAAGEASDAPPGTVDRTANSARVWCASRGPAGWAARPATSRDASGEARDAPPEAVDRTADHTRGRHAP